MFIAVVYGKEKENAKSNSFALVTECIIKIPKQFAEYADSIIENTQVLYFPINWPSSTIQNAEIILCISMEL